MCDGIDNDCDGIVDNGFHLGEPCPVEGRCPQTRVCSADKMSSACEDDERLFDSEVCDGVDNDCDGLVDFVAKGGGLQSECSCERRALAIGEAADQSIPDGVNLCADTRCELAGAPPQLQVDGKCFPVCQADGDTDGEGWGWENGKSCLDERSPRGSAATPCTDEVDSPAIAAMPITYCLDCSGDQNLPYAMCEIVPTFDLSAFAQGNEWLRVNYTYTSDGPAGTPVNIWFDAGDEKRKHLPLVRVGDAPGRYERRLRVDEACFKPSALFGPMCENQGLECARCRENEVCGATMACGDYDLSQAKLEVAAEFCDPFSGIHRGTVTVHQVELVEPNCDE